MAEALILPVTLEMAGKPLAPANGKVWQGKCIVWALQRENRWGRVPAVGPTGHLNRQIAHLHLHLRAGAITSQCLLQSYTHCCIQPMHEHIDLQFNVGISQTVMTVYAI